MYYDERFENALKEAKNENFAELKEEVAGLQKHFEAFLNKFFSSSTHNVEQDYNVLAV